MWPERVNELIPCLPKENTFKHNDPLWAQTMTLCLSCLVRNECPSNGKAEAAPQGITNFKKLPFLRTGDSKSAQGTAPTPTGDGRAGMHSPALSPCAVTTIILCLVMYCI